MAQPILMGTVASETGEIGLYIYALEADPIVRKCFTMIQTTCVGNFEIPSHSFRKLSYSSAKRMYRWEQVSRFQRCI